MRAAPEESTPPPLDPSRRGSGGTLENYFKVFVCIQCCSAWFNFAFPDKLSYLAIIIPCESHFTSALSSLVQMSSQEHFVLCSRHAKHTFPCFGFLWVDKLKCICYLCRLRANENVLRTSVYLFPKLQQFGSAKLRASTAEVSDSSWPGSEPITLTSTLNIGMNEPKRRERRRRVWNHLIPPLCFLEDASPLFSLFSHVSTPPQPVSFHRKKRKEAGEWKKVNCKTPRFSAAPSSHHLLCTTTTTAGGSHVRLCSVAFTGRTGSSLSACRPVVLTGRRTSQQVGTQESIFRYLFLFKLASLVLLSATGAILRCPCTMFWPKIM